MIPSFFPVWLTGGAWIVFGSIPAGTDPEPAPLLVGGPNADRLLAQYAPGVGLTPAQSARVGQRFVLQHEEPNASATPCIATVTQVRLTAVAYPLGIYDPTEAPENTVIAELLQMTDRRHVLGEVSLSGDCASFGASEPHGANGIWARPEGRPAVELTRPAYPGRNSADQPALISRATAAFRALPLWAPIQAEWVTEDEAKEYPLWDDGVGISIATVHAAERDWVYLSASASCTFRNAAWALWEVGANDLWTLRSDGVQPLPLPTFGAVADLDGDGLIELISNQGITSGAGGTWIRVLDTEVDVMGCAC